ncbi:hypothetical protein [Micromonospora aurantiaca (nom. illeg.)]
MWEIRLHPEVELWFLGLCTSEPSTADLVSEALDLLAEHGPAWADHWSTGSRAAHITT